jgi:hypothetical protein
MLVVGKPFDSYTTYLTTYRKLRSVAGIASWFTEFQPIRFPAREIIQLLMLEFFRNHLCCFMSGSFVSFMAGILYSFKGVTIHFVLTDSPIVRLIFQIGPEYVTQFNIKDFTFRLMEYNLQEDKFVYIVSRGDFTLLFFFLRDRYNSNLRTLFKFGFCSFLLATCRSHLTKQIFSDSLLSHKRF